MEIEFSPSQRPAAGVSPPAQMSPVNPPSVDNPVPQVKGMTELKSKLEELAPTRSDQLDAIQPALSDVQYPPEELLNGIANLLALHLTQ